LRDAAAIAKKEASNYFVNTNERYSVVCSSIAAAKKVLFHVAKGRIMTDVATSLQSLIDSKGDEFLEIDRKIETLWPTVCEIGFDALAWNVEEDSETREYTSLATQMRAVLATFTSAFNHVAHNTEDICLPQKLRTELNNLLASPPLMCAYLPNWFSFRNCLLNRLVARHTVAVEAIFPNTFAKFVEDVDLEKSKIVGTGGLRCIFYFQTIENDI
jgi:hypothetical protein